MSDDIVTSMNAKSLEENHIHLKARIEELEAAIQQARADAYAEALEAAAEVTQACDLGIEGNVGDRVARQNTRNIRALPNPYRETGHA